MTTTTTSLSEQSYDSFELSHLTPHLGSELSGLDLSRALDDAQAHDLRSALADRGVLVIRDQVLDREAHKALGGYFGELHVHPLHHGRQDAVGHDDHILVVKTTADSPYTAGDAWHADVTCDERPPCMSALYITETPAIGGGDTLFADMAMAHDLLSEPMRNFLSGLTAYHDGGKPYIGAYHTAPPEGGYVRTEHPVVIVHPVTGRRILFVNSGFTTRIRGLRPWESDLVLRGLYDLVPNTPRIQCRVRWEPNTVTLWDNFRCQHHAAWDYHPHSRYGERVSVLAAAPPVGVHAD